MRIPPAVAGGINVYQGRAVYLSDLTTADVRAHAVPRRPLAVGRTITASPAATCGSAAGPTTRAIGLHSRSRVTYAIPAGAVRFEAVVGLDEVDRPVRGRADPGVGRRQAVARHAGRADRRRPARRCGCRCRPEAKELTVLVDFGRGGDVQDHVDWADARIIAGWPGPPLNGRRKSAAHRLTMTAGHLNNDSPTSAGDRCGRRGP